MTIQIETNTIASAGADCLIAMLKNPSVDINNPELPSIAVGHAYKFLMLIKDLHIVRDSEFRADA